MPEVLIIGCGEVGVAYAEGLHQLEPTPGLQLLDPAPGADALGFADRAGLAVHREPDSALPSPDVVFLATPGETLTHVLNTLLPHLPPGVVIADLSTASAEAKQEADDRCRPLKIKYVDVAITGSVAVNKVGTPLLYAGPQISALMSIFNRLNTPVTVLKDSRPGDGMRVKLLRSVLMKGLEGLAVECLPVAEEYGVLDQLWASLADVDRTGFVSLLQAMTCTHPWHAKRREYEVAQAAKQVESVGYPSLMTRATEQRFVETSAAKTHDPISEQQTLKAAIAWLQSVRTRAR